MVFIITIVYGVIFGFATKIVIENKGYRDNWFWWGFFFGIIALIVACAKPEVHSYDTGDDRLAEVSEKIRENDIRAEGGWECAYCFRLNPYNVLSCACGHNKEQSEEYARQKRKEREEYLNRKKISSGTSDSVSAVVQSVSEADELKKFKELLDAGVISQGEFDTKKKQILGL